MLQNESCLHFGPTEGRYEDILGQNHKILLKNRRLLENNV
jgi:hypothetical protein